MVNGLPLCFIAQFLQSYDILLKIHIFVEQKHLRVVSEGVQLNQCRHEGSARHLKYSLDLLCLFAYSQRHNTSFHSLFFGSFISSFFILDRLLCLWLTQASQTKSHLQGTQPPHSLTSSTCIPQQFGLDYITFIADIKIC